MTRNNSIIAILIVLVLAGAVPVLLAAQAQPQPETILFNGKIITVDAKFSYAQAIAISDGKILAVGSNDEIRKLAGAGTRQLDLHDKAVIPGLMDNHLHGAGGGAGVDLSRVALRGHDERRVRPREG